MLRAFLVGAIACVMLAGCNGSSEPTRPNSSEPELAFMRWQAIQEDGGGAWWVEGWFRNVGSVTAYHMHANSCSDNSSWDITLPACAPSDSGLFWYPAYDSSGTWTYPPCEPTITGVANP